MDDVAPGILLGDDSRSIAKGLTSKTDRVLSKTSLSTAKGAWETALQAAKNGAADARATAENALPAATRFVSRMLYTTTYSLSYGMVFPVVFIARSIPANNAVVQGLIDGRSPQLTGWTN